MATTIGSGSGTLASLIPDLTDTANVQTALKQLYYGTSGGTLSTTTGIYGALYTLYTGNPTLGGNVTITGTLTVNGTTLSTNVITGTLALFNTNLTTATINMFGSLTTGTLNIASGTAGAKTINIGTSTGITSIAGTVINSGDGVILKTTSFTVGAGEKNYNVTGTASVTVTLPTATAGRTINIVNKAAFVIISASSNVYPRTTNTLGTAICAATAGSFATLVADGTNWYIMAGA